mmetsp:Transcript_26371/g.47337  ORF Transcript_26371/g.47337 Transcript_26371/m.47337 type:complete len:146 (-) Transcript_26371:34-471(-)
MPELAHKQLKPTEKLELLEPKLYADLAEGKCAIEIDDANELNQVLKLSTLGQEGRTFVRVTQACKPCIKAPHCKPDMKVTKHDAWSSEITLDLVQSKFEPPWVHRSKGSIQFTEAMIDQTLSSSVSSSSVNSALSQASSFGGSDL